MPPKSSNDKSVYKSRIKLDIEKRKHGEVQAAKVDLTKMNINTLANIIGVLSEDVNMHMYLPTAKICYVLNDRTINLPMKGNVVMSATSHTTYHRIGISDLEAEEIVKKAKEVETFIV